jgi:hypothetical protein
MGIVWNGRNILLLSRVDGELHEANFSVAHR